MRESSTYQEILREGRELGLEEARRRSPTEAYEQGRLEQARRTLLRVGSSRFGPPTDLVRERICSIERIETLEAMIVSLVPPVSWDALLSAALLRDGWAQPERCAIERDRP